MRAEGPHLRGYEPNFRAAVNEQASTNAGCRYLRRTRELRSSRRWTTGLLLLLPLTAVISIQFVSVAKAAIVGGPSLSAESFGAIELSSCKLSGVPQPTRCGVLEVPENPNRPAGRQLKIGVAVIPATGGKSRPDPIVILMGGPGEDAISAAEVYVKQFTTLRQDRDILLVDQRGTGRSGALNCTLFSAQEAAVSLRDVFPPAAVEKCEQNLRVRADLTQYTYDRFANDLEQVRQALGYGPLNLFGGSYGTRAAQVYLRMYPKSVRTVYMGSVVPLDAATPLPFAKTGQTALEKMFDACAGDFACNTAFPNLREEFRLISARLSSGSVRVTVQGQTGTVPLDRGRVAEWFRSRLYRPRSSTALPWMINRAFLGDYRVRQQQAACKFWPKASLPKDYREIQSSVPTVFASGDTDGATPLWYTEHAAKGFSHRLEVVLRGQGHTEWNECIAKIYQEVVISGSVGGGTSTCPLVPRPPFRL